MILAKAPFRISFFGGGSDFPEWFENNRARVLSTTINQHCMVGLRELPRFFDYKYRVSYSKVETVATLSEIQHPVIGKVLEFYQFHDPLEIFIYADLPARTGIGSSSAFLCAFLLALNTLRGISMSKYELAVEAIKIERTVVKDIVGYQDQIACAYGGLNAIDFYHDRFDVSPLTISSSVSESLFSSLILVYSGAKRISSDQAKKHVSLLSQNGMHIERMVKHVDECIGLLEKDAFDAVSFGSLLDESWRVKRSLTDSISSDELNRLYQYGIDSGASGGKVVGAGGAGFILFCVPENELSRFKQRFTKYVMVPVQPDMFGAQVVYGDRF